MIMSTLTPLQPLAKPLLQLSFPQSSLRQSPRLFRPLYSYNRRNSPLPKAIQSNEGEKQASLEAEAKNEAKSTNGDEAELSDIGAEIKKAMAQRKSEQEQKGPLTLNGVAEEIREIEWPQFGKVLGTTWVVLAVIAGSSVVLLTVNAVLAELSDRIFAGRGVQDFFN